MAAVSRDLEHSRRRARLREEVLIELARSRIATIGELSKATGVRASRVGGILVGDGREYAFDLSLVDQGAAERLPGWGADAFAITREGAREVDEIFERRRGYPATWDHVGPFG